MKSMKTIQTFFFCEKNIICLQLPLIFLVVDDKEGMDEISFLIVTCKFLE